MFPHVGVFAEHFGATFVGTGDLSGHLLTAIPFRLDPENEKEKLQIDFMLNFSFLVFQWTCARDP